MFADIQRLESAARLSMGTFQEADVSAERQASYGLPMMLVLAAIAGPCIALLFYY